MIEEVRLDDLITLQRGFDISEKEQLEGNVPVISSGGFSSYHNEYKVTGPGVVIGRKGTLGKVFYTTENYWPHSTSLWVKDFKGNDPKFIYYLLQVLHFEKFDSGAANPTLNRNHIHSLKIKVPKKKYRSPIASILSAYDELIENNKQRIKLLEEMAEEIYKEWFVRLRFPNYKNTEFVDGLPNGWENVYFRDFIKLNRGFDLPDDKITAGEYPVIASTSIKAFHHEYKVEAPCVVTGRSGSLGSVQYINKKSWPLNTSLYVKDFKGNSAVFAYYYLKNRNLETFNSGAGVPTLNQNHLHGLKLILPPKSVQKHFDKIIIPMFDEIEVLSQKNQLLQQTRDLLLPRLISGKLNVEVLAAAKEYVIGQNAEPWGMAAEAEGEYHH